MTHTGSTKIFLMLALLVSMSARANDTLNGLYQTEAGDSGGYLHVRIGPCADVEEEFCGIIEKAFQQGGAPSSDYAHIGKKMLWGMKKKNNGKYAGGKIWAPDRDKTYRSKMRHDGTDLTVKGCVGPLCRTQSWQRVE